jgi:hypothetical protein
MPIVEGVVYCAGCGVEVVGPPVVKQGTSYCCAMCADGAECDCGEVEDDRDEPAAPAA